MHAHGIPDDFPESVIAETRGARAADARRAAPTCATCRSSPSIPPTRATTTTPSTPSPTPIRSNAGGCVVIVAIADVAHYVRPAPSSTARRSCAATRSISPTASCRCCRSSISNDLCSLREGEDRALPRRAHGLRRARRQAQPHASCARMMRSAAKLTYQEAQAAIDGKPSRQGRAAAGAGAEAAVGRLRGAGAGARRARAARSRSARAQDRARRAKAASRAS